MMMMMMMKQTDAYTLCSRKNLATFIFT